MQQGGPIAYTVHMRLLIATSRPINIEMLPMQQGGPITYAHVVAVLYT